LEFAVTEGGEVLVLRRVEVLANGLGRMGRRWGGDGEEMRRRWGG
tara:strand:+ start:202 stop:336 length:135 start_codon:yes stop_codon:yes gene_type:complete